jgi:hypothetical protein
MGWGEPTEADKALAAMWSTAIRTEADIWTLLSPERQQQIRARIEWAQKPGVMDEQAEREDYTQKLEDACEILWGELPMEQVRILRDESPRLIQFLTDLHHRVSHEQAMTRSNTWRAESDTPPLSDTEKDSVT